MASLVVRRLSLVGEHSALWLGLAAAGAALDPPRRRQWVSAAVSVLQAHAVSVVLKRLVRRTRPAVEERLVEVSSEWTFPSSHATGGGAAVVAFSPLVPVLVTAPVAFAVAWSRVRLRVHHRRDVVAGAALGVTLAAARRRRLTRREGHRPAPRRWLLAPVPSSANTLRTTALTSAASRVHPSAESIPDPL